MMDSNSNQSNQAFSSGIDKLMTAHNEIIKAWFSHWNDQERSRIELAFDKSSKTLAGDRHRA